ncbi:MAG TPA: threonine/serine dehydratase [Candidatus Baltobacteraceae bacterium]|nr:threonine/serine dehydratase [Candidatus Baltobacteraceae bacterium]
MTDPTDTGPRPPLVGVVDIMAAAERLDGITIRTPLLPYGERAWLKPESLQPIGAFKLRGAYNAIATLPPAARAAGVVTHSSGNHGQGVARAARLLGVLAVVVMPADAPQVKVDRVRADGAEIVLVGPSSDERAARAADLARERGLTLVNPFDDDAVIAGQGTVGLEIVEQIAELDEPRAGRAPGEPLPLTVLVPIGGGGLASGVATAVRSLRPDAQVWGVEPELAADARDSLREDRLVRWEPSQVGRTIADGMRPASIGARNLAHLRVYLTGVLVVSEDEIRRAMVRLADEARLVIEPSGATTLAAWCFHAAELPPDGRVVAVLSGGNVDPGRYAQLIAEGRAAGG